jgi:MbtH protein
VSTVPDWTVVINTEEQYSVWPGDRTPPAGWDPVGVSGSREECLARIAELWTDLRPSSVRRRLESLGEGR